MNDVSGMYERNQLNPTARKQKMETRATLGEITQTANNLPLQKSGLSKLKAPTKMVLDDEVFINMNCYESLSLGIYECE